MQDTIWLWRKFISTPTNKWTSVAFNATNKHSMFSWDISWCFGQHTYSCNTYHWNISWHTTRFQQWKMNKNTTIRIHFLAAFIYIIPGGCWFQRLVKLPSTGYPPSFFGDVFWIFHEGQARKRGKKIQWPCWKIMILWFTKANFPFIQVYLKTNAFNHTRLSCHAFTQDLCWKGWNHKSPGHSSNSVKSLKLARMLVAF